MTGAGGGGGGSGFVSTTGAGVSGAGGVTTSAVGQGAGQHVTVVTTRLITTGAGAGHETTGHGAGHETTGHGAGHETVHGGGHGHGLLYATPNPYPPKPQHLLLCLAYALESNPATINKSNASMMKTGYLVFLVIIYLPPLNCYSYRR